MKPILILFLCFFLIAANKSFSQSVGKPAPIQKAVSVSPQMATSVSPIPPVAKPITGTASAVKPITNTPPVLKPVDAQISKPALAPLPKLALIPPVKE